MVGEGGIPQLAVSPDLSGEALRGAPSLCVGVARRLRRHQASVLAEPFGGIQQQQSAGLSHSLTHSVTHLLTHLLSVSSEVGQSTNIMYIMYIIVCMSIIYCMLNMFISLLYISYV